MSRTLVVRQAALTDLKNIYDYIAERAGDEITDGYVASIETATVRLIDYPDIGTPQYQLMAGLRSISFERRIRIFYLPTKDRVEIARVIHVNRDLGSVFGITE